MLSKDELINEFFINNKFNIKKFKSLDNNDIRKISLLNYYKNSSSLREIYTRLKNNWDNIPVCPVCGKQLIWLDSKNRFQNHCSISCATKDINVQKKKQQTCLQKYGVKHAIQNKSIKEKVKQTCLQKYGVEYVLSSNIIKSKAAETKLKKYGSKTYNNSNQTTYTCIKKYGSGRNNKKSEETMLNKFNIKSYLSSDYIKSIRNNKEIQNKIQNTKRKNNTFNVSNSENESYILLKQKYNTVIRQYKSDLYPFNCDFYIPDLNLYIECNYHWTHGGHQFNKNNIDDQNKLKLWKSKNTKFYNNAINCWTILDVKKRNIAKQNKLNFIEFWSINELKKYINKNII